MRWHLIALLLALIVVDSRSARADVVVTNEDQGGNFNDIWTDKQVGVAVLVASTSINVTSVQMNQQNFHTTADETFAIYLRNPDGTLGSLYFSDFTNSVPTGAAIATGTPNSPLVLAPNTGYWLTINSGPSNLDVNVDATQATGFTGNFGVTMAQDGHTVTINPGTGPQYGPPSVGPPIFQINGTAVPEPSSLALLGLASFAGLLRGRARSRI